MDSVIFTGLMVGGATIFGGALGMLFRRIGRRANDFMLSFAAGVMLAAAIIGFVLPSLDDGGAIVCVAGLFLGALMVNLMDLPLPFLLKNRESDDRLRKVCLFVMAIALHNLPEGVAAGVGLGTGDDRYGIMIALAIAMQNIPEGIIVAVAMRGVGVRRGRAFMISAMTGVIEIFGTVVGYIAAWVSAALLPMVLAIAGGTMLYVISEEMIPESHSAEGRGSTYFLLFGFSFMLILSALLKN